MPYVAAPLQVHALQQPWFLLRPGAFLQQHASTFTRGMDARQRFLCLQLLPVLCLPNASDNTVSFQPGTQALDLKLHRDSDGSWGGVDSLAGLAAAFPQQGVPSAGAVWCAGVQQDTAKANRWFLYINASEERPACGKPLRVDGLELAMQEDDCYLLNKHLTALDVHKGWCASGAHKHGVPFCMTFLLDGRRLVDGSGAPVQRQVTVGAGNSRRLQCVGGGKLQDALQEARPEVDAGSLRPCGVRVSTAPDRSHVLLEMLLVTAPEEPVVGRGGGRKRAGRGEGLPEDTGGRQKRKRSKTSHLRMILNTFPTESVLSNQNVQELAAALEVIVKRDVLGQIAQCTDALTLDAARQYREHQQRRCGLEAELQRASGAIIDLEERLRQASQLCAEADARHGQLQAQVELLQKKLQGLSGNWRALRKGVSSVCQQLAAKQAQAHSALAEARAARSEAEARLTSAMDQRAELQRQLEGMDMDMCKHLYDVCMKTVSKVLQEGLFC